MAILTVRWFFVSIMRDSDAGAVFNRRTLAPIHTPTLLLKSSNLMVGMDAWPNTFCVEVEVETWMLQQQWQRSVY